MEGNTPKTNLADPKVINLHMQMVSWSTYHRKHLKNVHGFPINVDKLLVQYQSKENRKEIGKYIKTLIAENKQRGQRRSKLVV